MQHLLRKVSFPTRRQVTFTLLGILGGEFSGSATATESNIGTASPEAQAWLAEWISKRSRAPGNPLKIARFGDPVYYLVEPIQWFPDARQSDRFKAVEAPAGFVTDLASIPRIFWSVLPTNGDYVYAAVIHDYLYWAQYTTKDEADKILDLCMDDFGIGAVTRATIIGGVSVFGQRAWDANKEARESGQSRLLKKFPDNASVKWTEWRNNVDAF